MTLTAVRLRELLHYDPETGQFTRLKHSATGHGGYRVRAAIGAPTGWTDQRGYVHMRIDGRKVPAHRLAWLYVTGRHPDGDIDHIDGNPSNNRFSNLREATRSQNLGNRKININNHSGVKGVHLEEGWESKGGGKMRWRRRWRATLGEGGKKTRLGRFKTLDEAKAAREVAAKKFYGEFYRER